MSVIVDGTSGLIFNDASTQTTAATGFGFKNRIINGAMVIDQRNAGASGNTATSGAYNLDRWNNNNNSGASRFTVQQNAGSVTPPVGFANYLGCTSTGAYSIAAGDVLLIRQNIEGYNVADLAWGTASASPITLSFWVRSSLTGTFGGSIKNPNAAYSYPFTYIINAANTWEYETIVIPGPTASTWNTSNSGGVELNLSLGTGSNYNGTAGAWAAADYRSATGGTSVVGTSGATFYVTGVQLEKGSTATAFDYRDYGRELIMCQRYFQRNVFDNDSYPFSAGYAYATNTVAAYLPLAVAMRATPTAAIVVNMCIRGSGLTNQNLSSLGTIFQGLQGVSSVLFCNPTTSGTSLTASSTYVLCNQGGQSGFTLSAEL